MIWRRNKVGDSIYAGCSLAEHEHSTGMESEHSPSTTTFMLLSAKKLVTHSLRKKRSNRKSHYLRVIGFIGILT